MSLTPAPYWQIVLEAFVEAKEPITLLLPGVKISRSMKQEAAMYLVDQGLIEPGGRLRREFGESTYSVTPEGRFLFNAVKGTFKPRVGKMRHSETTVAQRAHAKSPVDVFDLVRVPWVWDKASEERAQAVEEICDEVGL